MKRLILALTFGLYAFAPIAQEHETPAKVDAEFFNVYDQAQPKQFRVVTTTPSVLDTNFKDGEIVIFSSGAVKLMLRSGQEIYAINVSCITIRR